MNRELIIKVRDTIAAHPEHYEQDVWFSPHADSTYSSQRLFSSPQRTLNEIFPQNPATVLTDEWSCGSTACIAGHALLLHDDPDSLVDAIPEGTTQHYGWVIAGAAAFDISEKTARALFLDWPDWTIDTNDDGYRMLGRYYAGLTEAEMAVVLLDMMLDGHAITNDLIGQVRADRVAALKGTTS